MKEMGLLEKFFQQPDSLPPELQERVKKETGESIHMYALCDISPPHLFDHSWIAVTCRHFVRLYQSQESGSSLWCLDVYPLDDIGSIDIAEGFTINRMDLLKAGGRTLLASVFFTRRQLKAVSNIKVYAEQRRDGALPTDADSKSLPAGDPHERYRDSIIQTLRDAKSTVITRQNNVFLRLLSYLGPHKKMLIIGFVCSIVLTFLQLLPPYLTRLLVDDVLASAERGQLDNPLLYVWLLVGGLAFIWFFSEFANFVRLRIMSLSGEKIATYLRDEIYRHIQKLSLSFYNQRSTGSIISRITADTDRLWDFVTFGILEFIIAVITLIGVAVALFLQDASLAAIVVIPLPLMIYLFYRHSQKMQGMFLRIWRKSSALTAVLSDVVPGIRVVRAFAQEKFEIRRFAAKNQAREKEAVRLHKTWTAFWPRMIMLMHLSSLIVWAFGAPRVLRYIQTGGQEGMPLGVFIAFTGYMWMFWGPLQNIGMMTRTFNRAISSASRVFEILDTAPAITTKPNAVKLSPLRGHVVFDNVDFSYDGVRAVLKGINFEVFPGEMIGLVGASGSGKSTLVNLICRFYDTTGGAVRIDGYDVRDVNLRLLRRQIGVVLQEPYLFHGTIAENIAYGQSQASLHQIIEAARAANAHDFICRLPDGYDSLVGERGLMLSGGERQRISIARAILHNPKLLILDEATSSVDTETEKNIQEALQRLVEGRTTFAIAHRLSTLSSASRLFVMENGHLVEQGTHAELLADPDGAYTRLHRTQAELQSMIAV